MGHTFKNSNKIEKEDNVRIKVKYLNLFNKKLFYYFFFINLIK